MDSVEDLLFALILNSLVDLLFGLHKFYNGWSWRFLVAFFFFYKKDSRADSLFTLINNFVNGPIDSLFSLFYNIMDNSKDFFVCSLIRMHYSSVDYFFLIFWIIFRFNAFHFYGKSSILIFCSFIERHVNSLFALIMYSSLEILI